MVGPDALVQAATMTPDQLAALGLTVEQIDQARTVVAPAPRVVQLVSLSLALLLTWLL
jgi:hypothetical protein